MVGDSEGFITAIRYNSPNGGIDMCTFGANNDSKTNKAVIAIV